MLVLTRRKSETIAIGSDVMLTVIEFGEDIVLLRINFPLQIDPNLFFEFWTGEDEEFKIGAHIVGKVVRLGGERVRIRIDADPGVSVDRLEVRQAKLAARTDSTNPRGRRSNAGIPQPERREPAAAHAGS